MVAEILKTDPPPLSRARPGVPGEFSGIVAKAMRKNRDERYEGAAQLLTDLQNLRDDLRFRAKLGSAGRLRTRRTVLAGIALAAVLGAGYYGWRTSLRHRRLRRIPAASRFFPFANIRPDPATDFLGFSLADAIITKVGLDQSAHGPALFRGG